MHVPYAYLEVEGEKPPKSFRQGLIGLKLTRYINRIICDSSNSMVEWLNGSALGMAVTLEYGLRGLGFDSLSGLTDFVLFVFFFCA